MAATQDKGEKSADRDANGKFLPGHGILSPGRPPGSMDFMAICRRKARENDLDLESVVWDAFESLVSEAKAGEVPAIKLLLERCCGIMEKGPTVAVQINQNMRPIHDQARDDLKAMLDRGESDDTMLDELERRTMKD